MTTELPDLLDPSTLERCAAEGSLAGLIAEWSARLAGADDDELRRVVLAALRMDLGLIVRAPELLFPCVYNRVYWHGSAEAAAFYGAGSDLGAPLRAWAERWRAARGRRGAWGRSLRPPEFALLGALREEYRGALRGKGGPKFSRDGEVVGVASAPAWERATGRELTAEAAGQRLDVSGPRFEIDWRSETWGRARVLERPGKAVVVEVDVDGDSKFSHADGLADGTAVFVAGWCDDYDGVIARIAPADGKVCWRARVGSSIHALACDAAGTLVAASDGARVHLVDGTSGATLASVPLEAHSVALTPDGSLLATCFEDVVRVWEVAALRRERPRRIRGAHEGWIDACFTPDGRRLLTGKLLCDGRDGRLLARLDLDGPGYLEGGPPMHGRMLADERFVEMAPMRGVCVWNTSDGSRVLADLSRRYAHWHEIVLSPDGRWYVRGRRSGSEPVPLSLCVVDDGRVVAELGSGDPDCVAFTPDSRRLLIADAEGLSLWWTSTGARAARLTHPAAITGVAVSRDGSCAVTGARDGVLRVWDLGCGELRGARPLTADDPLQLSYSTRDGETRTWRATTEALARLEGWSGFTRAPQHGRTVQLRDGLAEIVDAGRVRVRIPAHAGLVADPSGTRWAFRAEHFAVEDDEDG